MTVGTRSFVEFLPPRTSVPAAMTPIAVETVAVQRGLKPAARFTAHRSAATEMRGALESAGFHVKEFVPRPEEWGYAHATREERLRFSETRVRIYYAAAREELKAAVDAQMARDDVSLGRALGYPECCIGAIDVPDTVRRTDMVRFARSPGRSDWRLNVFLTEMDVEQGSPYYLVSHFPCRLDCTESIAYADALFRTLREEAPEFAVRLEQLLTLPVLLRDEPDPPEERRYGNYGALLLGFTADGHTYYDQWRSLRASDDLHDAGLDRGNCLTMDATSIRILDIESGGEVATLPRNRWHLVAF